MENQSSNPQEIQPKKPDTTASIVAYLGPFGWIIGYVLYSSNKNEFNTFHLRQALGASLIAVFGYIAAIIIDTVFGAIGISFIGMLIYYAVYIIAGIFFIIGLINAANGAKKYLPLIGEKFETMFAGIVK